jgi:hypothetical protein
MAKLTENDKDKVAQAVKHAKLIEGARKMARMVRHANPPPEVCAFRDDLETRMPDWLRHHGGEAFDRPWSRDHLRVLGKIGLTTLEGGTVALAMPRGEGKTTILKWVCLYILMTGRRKYVVIVAATGEMGQVLVEFCRQQITESDSLHAHYPHVTTYARATDGKAIKARFQLRADGKSSGIEWSKNTLVFPEVMDQETGGTYPSNGAILEGHGLTGAIRGKWKDTKTGKVLRPDFVLLDDPQTRESGESDSQCDQRERIITGDILGLAGPKKRIAAVMPCTVIRKGDLAHRFLDHSKHPEWQGETCRLVNKWPDAQETLWVRYAEVYKDAISDGRGMAEATEFYQANREAMDAGAEVSSEFRIRDGEISALQTAQNLRIESGPQFWAEYQNEPIADRPEADYDLRAEHITKRTNGLGRGLLPDDAVACVAFADINKDGLAVIVLAGTSTPCWSVIDYDKWLPPGRKTIWEGGDKASVEKAVAEALEQCTYHLLAKGYGERLDAIAFDAGSDWARVVHDTCKALRRALPTRKIYSAKGASGFQYDPPRDRKGILRQGHLCDLRRQKYGTAHDMLMYWDSSYWHMTTQQGWLAPLGGMAGMTVYGSQTDRHPRLAEECAADKLEMIEYRGDKRQARFKNTGPNHWGDALAGAAALLSTFGLIPAGGGKLRDKALYRPAESKREPVTPAPPVKQPEKPAEQPHAESILVRRKPVVTRRGGFASRLW